MKIRHIWEAKEFIKMKFALLLKEGKNFQEWVPYNIVIDTLQELNWQFQAKLGNDAQYSIIFKNDDNVSYMLFGSLLSNEVMIQKSDAEV